MHDGIKSEVVRTSLLKSFFPSENNFFFFFLDKKTFQCNAHTWFDWRNFVVLGVCMCVLGGKRE